ncbi:hypothetical protein N8643_01230 [bacterium]|nr:hypothetical protein [Akkermansiaceae bacterium]MDA7671780.1 hypothetical protein [bacterium]MDA7621140.1 hypothetical protein [Akkermansiaceae bacterium]MDA7639288.1 hypothetical protein [Akkermansiaceae bacterium]MDA7675869.1 hypothetical protein [Akkermansiaceae bacterium]
MTELLNDPALTPSLIGFLVGVVFTSIFAAMKGKIARSVALAKEKVTEEKLAAFQSKTSALENEISTLRSSETRFVKHQGELEALTKADKERREEMKNFLDRTQATLTDELKRQEMVLKEAINKSQIARATPSVQAGFSAPAARATKPASQTGLQDDRDFVPLQNPAGEGPAENQFEGFAPDPSIAKAESAANSLRAAIEEGNL